MKLMTKSAVALLATTAVAHAGGVERSNQSVSILFEEGTYAELSFSRVVPEVSGTIGGGAVSSGDMTEGYNNYALRYRQDLTDSLSLALILENHIGADVDYPVDTGYIIAGSRAELVGDSFTVLARYEFPSNFSVYGGLRAGRASGEVLLQPSGYSLETSTETDLGYVLGVAYEIPEIALRVALTYNSEYTHDFESAEDSLLTAAQTGSFETTIPQSLMLEAQSGIAEDTLLFGSVRWVDWTAFEITPDLYTSGALAAAGIPAGSQLVSYEEDFYTVTLGVGRRFSDEWSGAVSVVWENEVNELTGNLGPTDGRIGFGLGATYTAPNGVEITGGIQYSVLGNAFTRGVGGDFRDNDLLAAGFTVGTSF